MTPAETLLSRLEGVRSRGAHQWSAKCPAHEDKTPSLSIRECDDGRLLINDFGGCETRAVIESVGLEFADLFPEKLPNVHRGSRRRPRLNGWAVVEAISYRLNCICLAAEAVRRGETMSAEDWRTFDESIADVRSAVLEAKRVN